jgi:putative transposase
VKSLLQIGQLKVELDWVKKNQDLSVDKARRCIDPFSEEISIARQCELLGLNRSIGLAAMFWIGSSIRR